jgi:ATP diphosphatase
MRSNDASSKDDEGALEKGDNNALNTALSIQLKCAELGFDWPDVSPVFDKVLEEIDEVKAEVFAPKQEQAKIEDEIGDLFFAAINLARHLHVDPVIALEKASSKFTQRFDLVEQYAKDSELKLEDMSLEELELLWQEAKRKL